MTYIVSPRNKKEEKALVTILNGLSIGFYTEEKEDAVSRVIFCREGGKAKRNHNWFSTLTAFPSSRLF